MRLLTRYTSTILLITSCGQVDNKTSSGIKTDSSSTMAVVIEGKFIRDSKTNCKVWDENYSTEDSISWVGDCQDSLATGGGILVWYSKGKETARYEGFMEKGICNGHGKLTFAYGGILEGNFVAGHFLNLDEPYLKRLEKNIISTVDTTDLFISDGNSKSLFYQALVPREKIKGVLVLLPGTTETTEDVISSNREICQMSFDNNIAVLVPSLNQRLTLNQEVLNFLNTVFKDAISRYKLPKEKFVLAGWSMGGLMSVRYTEMAKEDSTKTTIVPKAVYSVDGPVDLATLYKNFERKLEKKPDAGEPKYGIQEFKKYIGGSPENFREKYIYYSNFSLSEKDGGNAKYLKNTPIRIYDDVDVNWWMKNRDVDMYDMNALDQSAMILQLNDIGNYKAEFINAFGKGYRIDGRRHPHSWSIVDPTDCLAWIMNCLK